MTSESERVFSDVDPFYHDGGSTRGASRNATASTVLRKTTCSAHLLRKPDDSTSFWYEAAIAEVLILIAIGVSAAFRTLSCIRIRTMYILFHDAKRNFKISTSEYPRLHQNAPFQD